MNTQLRSLSIGRITTLAIRRESKVPLWKPDRTALPASGSFPAALAIISLSLATLWLSVSAACAADEGCASCSQQVSVTGDFAHRKDNASVAIEGATSNAAAFREEINGKSFAVSIAHLPAGKYTIVIGEVETSAAAAGDRVFDVTSGDAVLAKDYDIVAAAGGARKVSSITGAVEHEDDAIKGPLTISFAAGKGVAKFNTFEIKNSSGDSVLAFNASELADVFSAAAVRVPEVKEPPDLARCGATAESARG